MGDMTIRIEDTGIVSVSVNGEKVGLIQEISVRATTEQAVPSVVLRFPKLADGEGSDSLRESMERYEKLAKSLPWTTVERGDSVPAESELVRYFADAGEDAAGRKLWQVMQKDDSWYERTHDFVQWLLPTRRRSRYEPGAPTLTDEDTRAFQSRKDLSERYLFAVDRMESFLQLDRMAPSWLRRKDHNHKRISRLIESLRDLGFRDRATRVLEKVMRVVRENPDVIPVETVSYWTEAAGVQQR